MADVCCGSGHAVNVMAPAFPNSSFVGIDFSDEALAVARQEADRLGLTNASFVARDAATLDATHQYELITTFDAVPDQARPRDMELLPLPQGRMSQPQGRTGWTR